MTFHMPANAKIIKIGHTTKVQRLRVVICSSPCTLSFVRVNCIMVPRNQGRCWHGLSVMISIIDVFLFCSKPTICKSETTVGPIVGYGILHMLQHKHRSGTQVTIYCNYLKGL